MKQNTNNKPTPKIWIKIPNSIPVSPDWALKTPPSGFHSSATLGGR